MMKGKFISFAVVFAALLSTACDKVHEFPEKGKEVDPTEINTTLEVECLPPISEYRIVTKDGDSDSSLQGEEQKYDRRFVVQIRSTGSVDTLISSYLVTRDVADMSCLVLKEKLKARKYRLVVWMDYVLKGTVNDLYYNTGNGKTLNTIHVPSVYEYVAGTDFKDSQTYVSELDLTGYAGQWSADITVRATLYRPVAKITVLASDLAEYASSIGWTGTLNDLADNLVVETSYEGYCPTGYNAITGKLNDAQVGYKYGSSASYPFELEKKEYMHAGFDYVFVNGESSVTLTVRISTRSGQLVNEVNHLVVPTRSGKETILIYMLLTKEYVPGIGIDPGFDGEFNIII